MLEGPKAGKLGSKKTIVQTLILLGYSPLLFLKQPSGLQASQPPSFPAFEPSRRFLNRQSLRIRYFDAQTR